MVERAIACAGYQGFGVTYTSTGIVHDRLTHTQRRSELLDIAIPRPEQGGARPPNAENGTSWPRD